MAILAVDEVMLREPRLLVPGMQPLGQVKVDPRHPASKHIKFLYLGSIPTIARTNTRTIQAEINGTYSSKRTVNNSGITQSGTGNLVFVNALCGPDDGRNCSFVVVAESSLTSAGYFYYVGRDQWSYAGLLLSCTTDGAFDARYGNNLDAGPDGRRSFTSPNGTLVANKEKVICGAITSATTGQLYANGAPITTTVSGTATTYATSANVTEISRVRWSDTYYYGNQTVYLVVVFNTALPPVMLQSLSLDPYQFLIPH